MFIVVIVGTVALLANFGKQTAPTRTSELSSHPLCFNRKADRALLERTLSIVRELPLSTQRTRLAALASLDLRSQLSCIDTPALYFEAVPDRVVNASRP